MEKNAAVPAVDAVHRGTTLITLTVSAIGIVFGDIGTSPLYTLKGCFHYLSKDQGTLERADVLGVLSLVFWSLMLVVTMKYLMFVMRADNKGEGGIFACARVGTRSGAAGRPRVQGLALLAIRGAALLYGDGMITPAISVLSAVEGIAVTSQDLNTRVIPLTCGLLLLGREHLLASNRGLMPAWEERIFAFLHRNTASPDSFFGLPHQQVIEIGTQMDL